MPTGKTQGLFSEAELLESRVRTLGTPHVHSHWKLCQQKIRHHFCLQLANWGLRFVVTIIYIRKVASNVWYTVNSNEERTHYLWSEQDSSTKRNLILCSHKPGEEPEYEPWRSALWGVGLTFIIEHSPSSSRPYTLTSASPSRLPLNLLYLAYHLMISEYSESKLLHSSQFSISKEN